MIVFTVFPYGNNILTTTFAMSVTLRPCGSFSMRIRLVEHSVNVSMTCPQEFTMMSISQSQTCSRLSLRSVVNAHTVLYVGRFGGNRHPHAPHVFHFVWGVHSQTTCTVDMYVLVDGLLAYGCALLAQYAHYLRRRAVVLDEHLLDSPPQPVRFAVISFEVVFAPIVLGLRIFQHIAAIWFQVSLDFTAHC